MIVTPDVIYCLLYCILLTTNMGIYRTFLDVFLVALVTRSSDNEVNVDIFF